MPGRTSKENGAAGHQRHPVYASEAIGLLVIALLLLALTLIRHWHDIHGGLR